MCIYILLHAYIGLDHIHRKIMFIRWIPIFVVFVGISKQLNYRGLLCVQWVQLRWQISL